LASSGRKQKNKTKAADVGGFFYDVVCKYNEGEEKVGMRFMRMDAFFDYYGNRVLLSFMDHPFSLKPGHVWIICRYEGQWLLTNHPERGLEFPGGKVEKGETPEQAAVREVKEETGGIVGSLTYIGQYKVVEPSIIKNIYFAEIAAIVEQSSYLETDGPVLLRSLPENIRFDERFSFIMKDDVLQYTLKEMKRRSLWCGERL
jgi:8-oxo-dGTP diphosphatase